MYFTFSCPQCNKRLKVREEATGRKAACPYCRASVVVPSPPRAPAGEEALDAFKGIGETHESSRLGAPAARKQAPTPPTPKEAASGSRQADRTDVSMLKTGLIGLAMSAGFYAALLLCWGAWLLVFPPNKPAPVESPAAESASAEAAAEEPARFLREAAGVEAAARYRRPARADDDAECAFLFGYETHHNWLFHGAEPVCHGAELLSTCAFLEAVKVLDVAFPFQTGGEHLGRLCRGFLRLSGRRRR